MFADVLRTLVQDIHAAIGVSVFRLRPGFVAGSLRYCNIVTNAVHLPLALYPSKLKSILASVGRNSYDVTKHRSLAALTVWSLSGAHLPSAFGHGRLLELSTPLVSNYWFNPGSQWMRKQAKLRPRQFNCCPVTVKDGYCRRHQRYLHGVVNTEAQRPVDRVKQWIWSIVH